MFATAALARRIEAAESTLAADVTRAVGVRRGPASVYIQAIGGGTAVFAGAGSPFNKVAGVGFEALDPDTLTAIEEEFGSRGAPVQMEVSTLADPAVGEMLTGRGYKLRGFENVLGLPLDQRMLARPDAAGIRIDTAPDDGTWIDVVATGFVHPDVSDAPASHESYDREALEQVFKDTTGVAGFERYLAWRDDAIAGGGALRIWNGIAQLSGAATLPDHRRRGVQSALLRHRLAVAARAGCDIAVVTTSPGSKSQENVQRQGFFLLYARAVLVK